MLFGVSEPIIEIRKRIWILAPKMNGFFLCFTYNRNTETADIVDSFRILTLAS